MTPKQLTEISKNAANSSSGIYFAFGVSSVEGVLILSRHSIGKALMHDLVKKEGHRDLRSERYGKVAVGVEEITFSPNKPFDSIGRRELLKVLKKTHVKLNKIELDGRLTDAGDADA